MTADPVCRVLSWHSRELSSAASCWGRQVQSATSWEDTGPKHAHRSRATWRARAILNHWVLKNDLGGHHDKNRPCLVTKNHSPDGWEARLHASLNAFLHWEKIVNLFFWRKNSSKDFTLATEFFSTYSLFIWLLTASKKIISLKC